jgi:hypothetical protein
VVPGVALAHVAARGERLHELDHLRAGGRISPVYTSPAR